MRNPRDRAVIDAVFLAEERAKPHRRRHRIVLDAETPAREVAQAAERALPARHRERMPERPVRKHGYRGQPVVARAAQDEVVREREFADVERTRRHRTERVADAHRLEAERYAVVSARDRERLLVVHPAYDD